MKQPATRPRPRRGRFSLPPLLAILALAGATVGCGPTDDADDAVTTGDTATADGRDGDAYVRPSTVEHPDLVAGDTIPGHPSWTEQDWGVLTETVRWARGEGVDALPMGERIATLGEHFVGIPYVPQTLDPEGPEGLVVNLRAMDCVTFIENMMTLAHFLDVAPPNVLDDQDRAMELFADILTSIRYRDGTMNGYTSRLHYFSEWLSDNEEKGYVEIVTQELGGVADPEPITFMTAHRDSYRQLEEELNFEEVGRIEERLSQGTRYYIPEEDVAGVADRIRTGDLIAATSTLEGLDVAHTGIALWKDDVLHLMHAPLVGEDVQISERPLAERLLGISAQDGIMVARPLDGGAARFVDTPNQN